MSDNKKKSDSCLMVRFIILKGLKMKQDKGHFNEIKEFVQAIKNGAGYPIPLWQLIQATKISFEVEREII